MHSAVWYADHPKKKRKTKPDLRDYALYHGNEFIDLGTLDYLASVIGVKVETLKWYRYPTYQKRTGGRGYIVFLIEDDEEGAGEPKRKQKEQNNEQNHLT